MPETRLETLGPKCSICRDFDIPEDGRYVAFKADILPIQVSAQGGCQPCKILVAAYKKYIGDGKGCIKLQFPQRDTLDWDTLRFTFNGEKEKSYDVYTGANESSAPWTAVSRQCELSISAMDALAALAGWIEECAASHPACRFERLSLPTRVVDVGPECQRTPKLHVSSGEVKPYAALSHCWGKSSLLKTTAANLEKHIDSIVWEELSKTFQDAIICTQRLGIQYLWIDSLCIIQDSRKDWEIESAKMGSIYNGAEIVFAATEAADGSQGFLKDRQLFAAGNIIFTGDCGDGSQYSVRMRPTNWQRTLHIAWYNPQENHNSRHGYKPPPLEQRAWTYQERLLARRYVHFTRNELAYECTTSTRCECLFLDRESKKSMAPRTFLRALKVKKVDTIFWNDLVYEYCTRKLTFSTDFFPALSGVSRAMKEAGAGDFSAGIWRDSMPHTLLWHCSAARAVPYRAPTWSWASLDFTNRASDLWPGETGRLNVTVVAQVGKVTCELATDDPTGSVKSGSMILCGPMVQIFDAHPVHATPVHKGYIMKGMNRKVPLESLSSTDETWIETPMFFQADILLDNLDDLFMFLLTHVDQVPQGLVLQKKVAGGMIETFERVGCFGEFLEKTNPEGIVSNKGKLHIFEWVPIPIIKVV